MIIIREVKIAIQDNYTEDTGKEKKLSGCQSLSLDLSLNHEDKLLKRCARILKLRPNKIKKLSVLKRSLDARKKPELFFSYMVLLRLSVPEKPIVEKLRNPLVTVAEANSYSHGSSVYSDLPLWLLRKYKEGIDKCSHNSHNSHNSYNDLTNSVKPYLSDALRPLIVGFGPAGMFSALLLARAGLCPIVYERGNTIDQRLKDVDELWSKGVLNPESNPQFGEGGAGAFSDGKLHTLIKDTEGRGRFVLETFVRHGADPDILIDANPHIGSDRLWDIVRGIREEILELGGEIYFNRRFTKEDFENRGSRPLILAMGHSARDSLSELYEAGVPMEAKDFAMGFRIQHPQSMIDRQQYGDISKQLRDKLGPSSYKLHYQASNGRSVYSFCMCPGGYVLDGSSEKGRLCVNGMSYHSRNSRNANSAIIVGIKKEDFDGFKDPLGGLKLQRMLEERAYRIGGGSIPVCRYGDFKRAIDSRCLGEITADSNSNDSSNGNCLGFNIENVNIIKGELTRPMFRGRFRNAALWELFLFNNDKYSGFSEVNEAFVEAMGHFGRQIPGFDRDDAILAGVESRTSCPVRILRNKDFLSAAYNVYPCGEGAGYAGGIMSAAIDGLKVAEALIRSLSVKWCG